MQVVLKVVGGKNDGREITLSVPEFIIGRGESAHLRPSSDLISRKHCAIRVSDGQVTVADMGSRNGTFVNGEQLVDTHVAKSGDMVRVGRLQFNLLIDPVKAGAKKSKVAGAVEAVARAVEANSKKSASIEDSITDWLADAGGDDSQRRSFRSSDTVQLNLDETSKLVVDASDVSDASDSSDSMDGDSTADLEEGDTNERKKKKKEFGKLPEKPRYSHDDSTSAAGDVLKKFFNRR